MSRAAAAFAGPLGPTAWRPAGTGGTWPPLGLAVAALAIVSGVAGVLLDGTAAVALTNASWTASSVVAVLGLRLAARRARTADGESTAWRLLFWAGALWLAGQVSWDVVAVVGGDPAVAAAGHVLWLGFAVLALAAVTLLAPPGSRRSVTLLDLAALLVTTGAVAAAVFIADARRSALPTAEIFLVMAYPIIYGGLALAVAQTLLAGRGRREPGLRLLLAGTVLEAVAFVLWTPDLLAGRFEAGGGPLDLVWTAGMVVIGAAGAAMTPGLRLSRPLETDVRDGVALPAVAWLVLLSVLIDAAVDGESLALRLSLQLSLAAGALLFFARMWVVGTRQLKLLERERAATEHARAATAELDRFFATAPDLLCVAGPDGVFRTTNAHFERVLGYDEEEMRRRPFVELVHPDDQAATLAEVNGLATGRETVGFSNRYRHKDGSWVWLEWQATPTPDGLVYAAARDITDRKLAEKKLAVTASELERLNSDLEQFAYITSHDLSEPLRTITGFAQLLERRYPAPDERAERYVRNIVEGGDRMRRLIDDLLAYSRSARAELQVARVDCGIVARDVRQDLAAAVGEHDARVDLGELPVLETDATQLRIVLQNLVANALKFSAPGTPPRVHVEAWPGDGGEWTFSVRDEGIGIAPEYAAKVFAPFQRLHTRDRYPGTGIGLAICRRIVERLGGRIWVEPVVGAGTDLRFTLRPLETEA